MVKLNALKLVEDKKVLTVWDAELLDVIAVLTESLTVKLTQKQILMLQLSDLDIENGRLISQEQLDKADFV